MATITPVRINQIINKKPRDPVSNADWNEILNLVITQQNMLSEQLVTLQATITDTVVNQLNDLIATGTLTLNVDAVQLGGKNPEDYVLQTDLTTYSDSVTATYATKDALTAQANNTANTYATKTALTTTQTSVTKLSNRFKYATVDPGTAFVGEDVIVFVKG